VTDDRSSLAFRKLTGPMRALQAAVAFHSQGRLREAEQGYQIVLGADDRNFDALYRLGLIRLQQGRFGDAASLFRRAIKVDRASADAHHHLAVALSGLKRHDEAIKRYEKALAINPALAEAHNNLAHSLQTLCRMDEAMAHYQKALAIKPDYPEAMNNLGIVLQALGRSAEAMMQYEKAVAARPSFIDARKNLGNLLGAGGRHGEAMAQYEVVLVARPNDAGAHLGLGNILSSLDQPDAAMTHYRAALRCDPRSVEAHNALGGALHMLGRSEEAIRHHREALAIKPGDVDAHNRLGTVFQALGRSDDASAAFEKAVALSPGNAGNYWNLANSKRFAPHDPHLAGMLALAQDQASLGAEQRIELFFALGKAFGDIDDIEQSFHYLLQGNTLKRSLVDYDEAAALGRLARMRSAFTPELVREKRALGDPSDAPVFIVGMPRSGTTLIEQILASHRQVFGAGEIRVLANIAERISGPKGAMFPEAVSTMSGEDLRQIGQQYVNAVRRFAPEAARITDKMPGNFALAGLIHLALPGARIIHVRRDARDTALSCFSILFARGQEFTYDLAELGRYCAAYRRLMDHWHDVMPGAMLDVHYEDVVADLEVQARRIIAYCGLEWDDRCLEFYRTERSVRTASANQVRQPIYRSAVGRWRAHEERLRPLLQALG
jgi:tetratricopeptide (TPR) repeat protein